MAQSFHPVPKVDRTTLPSPVDNASIVSEVLYCWITPLIELGTKKPLEIDDIYEVPLAHYTMTSLSLFMSKYWKSSNSLGIDLIKCFHAPVVKSNLVFLLYVVASMLQPFLVSKILQYVSTGKATIIGIESGVGIVLLLGGISVVGIVAFNMGFYYIQEFALHARNTSIALIFHKSLHISTTARSKHTTGEIATLMSVDAERIFHGVLLSTWYWMGPLLILGALILLIFQVGFPATLLCCGVLLAWFWFQLNGIFVVTAAATILLFFY